MSFCCKLCFYFEHNPFRAMISWELTEWVCVCTERWGPDSDFHSQGGLTPGEEEKRKWRSWFTRKIKRKKKIKATAANATQSVFVSWAVTAVVQSKESFYGRLLTRLCLPQTLPKSRSAFTAPKLFGLPSRLVEERVLQHLSRLNHLPHTCWGSFSVIPQWLLEKNNLYHWFCMHKPPPRTHGFRLHLYICSTASCSSKKELLCPSLVKLGLVLITR